MKKKVKEIVYNNYFSFLCMFILVFFLHLFMDFGGDDNMFCHQLDNYSLFSYLSNRYIGWSSRLIIESILVTITKCNIFIWRVLDSFMYVLAAIMVSKLINTRNRRTINYICCLLFLIYPYIDMSSAGWVSTTLNYSWCFSLGMVSFLPLINNENSIKTGRVVYVLSTLGIIYATNQEQMCALIFGFNLIYFLYKIYKERKINKYNILCLIISIFSLLFIALCPGNTLRYNDEIKKWYPEFKEYGLFHKIYLGIVPTIGTLIDNKIILLVFFILLSVGAYLYSNKKITKVLICSSVTIISLLTIFKNILLNIFPSFEYVYSIFQEIPNFSIKYSYIPAIISIYIILSSIFMLLILFKKNQLLPIIIFLAGFSSRVIMGFSPTIFASENRTFFFFYMSLIIVIIYILKKLFEDKRINNDIMVYSVLTVIAIFNYINMFINI